MSDMSVYDYEEIYSHKVTGLTERDHLMESIPHEYRVVKLDSGAAGIMVWGRYENKWYANPSCRYLIAHLLSKIAKQSALKERESELALIAAQWEAVCDILNGEEPSDFMQSFPEVREVYDLVAEQSTHRSRLDDDADLPY